MRTAGTAERVRWGAFLVALAGVAGCGGGGAGARDAAAGQGGSATGGAGGGAVAGHDGGAGGSAVAGHDGGAGGAAGVGGAGGAGGASGAGGARDGGPAADAHIDRAGASDATHDAVGDGPLGGAGAPICSGDDWCWQNPLPQGNDLAALWAFSPLDIWAVGAYTTALHFDGQSWTGQTGSSRTAFTGVWGAAPDDVWMVSNTSVYHWDGAHLAPVPSASLAIGNAISGTGPGDIWTVSYAGGIAHYDGHSWTTVVAQTAGADGGPPVTVMADLFAVWASSPTSVWMGGNEVVLHWDGQVWTKTNIPDPVRGIWQNNPNDIWVLTGSGVRRFNGSTMTSVAGAPTSMLGISGTSATDVWVVNNLYAYHYDGSTWTTHANPNAFYGTAVLAQPTGALFAGQEGGLAVWQNASNAWTTPYPLSLDVIEPIDDMWGSGPSDIWTVGGIDGRYGSLTHFDGTSWTRTHLGTKAFTVVWGSGPSDVWAATGQSALAHYDGTAWTFSAPTFPTNSFGFPTHLSGRAANDIWMPGQCGTAHYDGSTWTLIGQPGCSQVNAIGVDSAGTVWGVGTSGLIVKLTGGLTSGTWTMVTSPTTSTLHDIFVVAPNDIWAAGDNGTIVHWNGTGWALSGQGVGIGNLTRVWASGSSDVWVAGLSGALGHFDGKVWSPSESGAGFTFNGLWGPGPGDVWVAGTGGGILRRHGGP